MAVRWLTRGVVALALAASIGVPAHAVGPGLAPSEDRPALSGTKTVERHTLTWSTSGASAVPASGELAANYDGVVSPGATVTFSGSLVFVLGEGAVTNLSQSAWMSGGSDSPSVSFSERVYGGTYTLPYNLSVTAPKPKGDVAKGTVTGSVTASARASNCNDSGVCARVSVELRLAVVSGGLDTTPPTISAGKPRGIVPIGEVIPVRFQVSDNSGKARWYGMLYSGGQPVAKAQSKGLVKATGATLGGNWSSAGKSTGPFYFCFWAEDAAGNRSANAPFSSCQWISVQVRIPAVSNGCGAATWGQAVADALNWAGDVRMYGNKPVNIRQACNQHDAGYAGVTVAGITTKKATDYRTWTRDEIDQKFYQDIAKQCARFLKGPANAENLKACRNDAITYVGLVRQFGAGAFDADVTVPGTQPQAPASTTPAGGARVNN